MFGPRWELLRKTIADAQAQLQQRSDFVLLAVERVPTMEVLDTCTIVRFHKVLCFCTVFSCYLC